MEVFAHPYLALGGLSAVLVLSTYAILTHLTSRRLPLPPGPKGFPVVGTLFDGTKGKTWLVYDEWFKLYGMSFSRLQTCDTHSQFVTLLGDMVYFKIFGQGFLVLGSPKRTNDLFDKRSANYSDRANMPMLVDL
jgi:hypothetical protein